MPWGRPAGEFVIQSLGATRSTKPGKIEHVELLGTGENLKWKQIKDGLRVQLPRQYRPATDSAAALKVSPA